MALLWAWLLATELLDGLRKAESCLPPPWGGGQEHGQGLSGRSVVHLPAVGPYLQQGGERRGRGLRWRLEPWILHPHHGGDEALVECGPGCPPCHHSRCGEEPPGLLFGADQGSPDPRWGL